MQLQLQAAQELSDNSNYLSCQVFNTSLYICTSYMEFESHCIFRMKHREKKIETIRMLHVRRTVHVPNAILLCAHKHCAMTKPSFWTTSFHGAFTDIVSMKLQMKKIQRIECLLCVNFSRIWLANTQEFPHYDPKRFHVNWVRGYKTYFMLNSTEHEFFPAHQC